MEDKKLCPCTDVCPVQNALASIGGKWKLPIICSLSTDGPSRYNELLKRVRGISNTMLSQTLKEMEADRLVKRAEYLEVPVRVEYELTERAMRLKPILEQLIAWSFADSERNT